MRLTFVRALLLTISLLFLHSSPASEDWDDEEVGALIKVSGEVFIKEAGKKHWEKIPKELLIDSPLSAGITVRTGLDSNASILLRDETLIKLDQVSEYTIEAIAPTAGWIESDPLAKPSSLGQQDSGIAGGLSGLTTLSKGGLWMLNKNREVALKFKTPTAIVGIRGTELEIRMVGEEQLRVSALEGVADISNEQGRLQLQPNEEANVVAGQAPTKLTLLNPADSVQWTLVVPQLVSEASFQNQSLPDIVKTQLKQVWSQLNSGRVKEAWSTLQKLNHSYPNAALVATLHGLTALMLNQKEIALESAKRATTIAPTFTDGWVVLAQVNQSKFDLKAAERAARKALEITPDNTLAAIILARLRFGTGYVEEAQSIIAAAIEKAPESGEAQNLLGFIELSLREHQKAESAFQKSIELENSASPHMGLGILRMRAGREKEALREMSIAVLLDPRRAMYRSYWAKMLYQMQRYQKALDVLDISKNIDPNDPTPHLYRALILRDLN
ncbi:MAG: tetratricopeptide repeat protein, partial [Gammaproteobacteria bacterium]|nr:tetratricopeptide repeat protein [Gammaproteobacteria bacterium]